VCVCVWIIKISRLWVEVGTLLGVGIKVCTLERNGLYGDAGFLGGYFGFNLEFDFSCGWKIIKIRGARPVDARDVAWK
jgi:hypothetical protein